MFIFNRFLQLQLESMHLLNKSQYVTAETAQDYHVQFSLVVQSCPTFATSCTAVCKASMFITNSQSLLMSVELVMPSKHLILYHPFLLLPSIFPSIRVFSNESVLHIRQPKYWTFSISISPSNEYSGMISFRIDYFDLLAVQGTLKSLLQHHSSKASILQHSVFFIVQLSHLYMITGKTIALTRQTPAAPRRPRRKWQLTSVFLPKKSHGQRSLAGYSPFGLKESDMTDCTDTQ